MPIQIPATIADDLFADIRKLIEPGNRYFTPDSREIRELLARADKLQKANAFDAFIARSSLYTMCGDRENALAQIKKAEALGFNRHAVAARCIALANLGYFSEAQEFYSSAADPTGGFFGKYGRMAVNCGALAAYERMLRVAEKMQLEVDTVLTRKILDALEIFAQVGITDADLGRYLDVAGEIMREQRLFYVGTSPEFFVWTKDEADQFVHFTYRVPVEAGTAERLDTELITRFVDRFGSTPEPVSITIKSGLSSNGRIAERSAAAGPAPR